METYYVVWPGGVLGFPLAQLLVMPGQFEVFLHKKAALMRISSLWTFPSLEISVFMLVIWLVRRQKVPAAHDAYERLALHEAIDACIALCAQGNQYLEKTEPWHLFKVSLSQLTHV